MLYIPRRSVHPQLHIGAGIPEVCLDYALSSRWKSESGDRTSGKCQRQPKTARKKTDEPQIWARSSLNRRVVRAWRFRTEACIRRHLRHGYCSKYELTSDCRSTNNIACLSVSFRCLRRSRAERERACPGAAAVWVACGEMVPGYWHKKCLALYWRRSTHFCNDSRRLFATYSPSAQRSGSRIRAAKHSPRSLSPPSLPVLCPSQRHTQNANPQPRQVRPLNGQS